MRTLALLLLVMSPALTLAQDAPSLASLKDKNRVLLISAPTNQSPSFERQLDILFKHEYDLRQRDLVLLPVVTISHPPMSADTLHMSHAPVASKTQQVLLRNRFHVAPDTFTVILIGKDGGEKLRQHTPITIGKLNATIDAMPMRQEEIRQQK